MISCFQTLVFAVASVALASVAQVPGVPEEPCNRAGGLCLPITECPKGQQAQSGLCPMQQAAGVECCHGLPESERRCARRGGSCRPRTQCAPHTWDDRATDCPAYEACCPLD